MYHQLGSGPISDEVIALRAAVDRATALNGQSLTVGLDALRVLEAPVLNGLIAGLRRLRNAGGTIRLHVTSRELLKTLDMTGLDRVFEVVARPDEPAEAPNPIRRPVRRKGKLVDGIAGLIAVLLVVASASMAAFAQSDPSLTGSKLSRRVVQRDPDLRSF